MTVEQKREEIARSEERLAYHKRRMEEVPRLRRLYEYWASYYTSRRASYLTDLWLEELRDRIKPEVRGEVSSKRADEIRDALTYMEDERVKLVSELSEARRLAVGREWRVRFPAEYPTMERWISSSYGRMAGIRYWMDEVLRELPPALELIGDESCTGYDIYFDLSRRIYIVKHPATGEVIREEDKICIELTASINTDVNHDVPITVEITATSYVTDLDTSGFIQTEKEMEEGLMNWLVREGWGGLLKAYEKEGIAYNGETHVDEKVRYPWDVPDYPDVHVYVERKSRFIPRREYEGDYKVE